MRNQFKTSEAAKIIGVTQPCLRKLKFLGLRPAIDDWYWSPSQVLGLAIRINSKRAGASVEASHAAFLILSQASISKLQKDVENGKRYLRLVGEICEPRLVTAQAAFHPKLLEAVSRTSTPYVVVDLGLWFQKLDGGESSVDLDTKQLLCEAEHAV